MGNSDRDGSSDGASDKGATEHIEMVHTNERVPGHTNYYEKDGLRTEGDDEDHEHEPPMSFSRMMSLIAMAFLWTGSQVSYLFNPPASLLF